MRSPSVARALVLLGVVLDPPPLGPAVRRLTREPRVEQTELGDVPVEVVRPQGRGPWPAWLFVNGAHPLRRTEPVVARLSRGLARAGYIVFVPDVPGLGEGAIALRTLEATVEVTEGALRHHDVAGGRIALIGASTGAALAVLAAGRETLADRISVVAAVAPFADLARMICLATTRGYAESGGFARYDVTDLHRRVVARSLVTTLADADERGSMLAVLDRAEREERDPVHALADTPARTPEGDALMALLANDDPERFQQHFGALPGHVRELLHALSPVTAAAGVRTPVEIVVPPSDVYFPPGEAQALAAALPDARLTITGTLDHTRPQLGLGRLRDLRAFWGFVTRGLAAAG